MIKNVWNKLPSETRECIGINAYKFSDPKESLLNMYGKTISMLEWNELDKNEVKIIEEYTKGY